MVELEGQDGGKSPSQLIRTRDIRDIGYIATPMYSQRFETTKHAGCDMSDECPCMNAAALVEGQSSESQCTCPADRLHKEVLQGYAETVG